MTIKILHLCLVFKGKYMWENRILNLAKEFKKQKKFDFIFYAPAKNPTKHLQIEGYMAREFKIIGPANAYLFSPKLLSEIKHTKANIIHCHGFNNLITLGALIQKNKKQKLILTINSSGSSSPFRHLLLKPYCFLFKLLAHRVDRFIPVTRFEEKHFSKLLGIPKEKFIRITNGIEKKEIETLKIKKIKGQIVTTGRLVKNKGFENVIKTFALITKKNKNATLIIIGDGPERNRLENLTKTLNIRNKVKFLGYIGPERRIEFLTRLKESEVFIFLSKYEGQGINTMEAITARLPCIIADNSGLHDYIENGEAIGIKDITDYNNIANIVERILESPKKYSPKKVFSKTWEEVAKKTLKVYEEVLNE